MTATTRRGGKWIRVFFSFFLSSFDEVCQYLSSLLSLALGGPFRHHGGSPLLVSSLVRRLRPEKQTGERGVVRSEGLRLLALRTTNPPCKVGRSLNSMGSFTICTCMYIHIRFFRFLFCRIGICTHFSDGFSFFFSSPPIWVFQHKKKLAVLTRSTVRRCDILSLPSLFLLVSFGFPREKST